MKEHPVKSIEDGLQRALSTDNGTFLMASVAGFFHSSGWLSSTSILLVSLSLVLKWHCCH